MTSMRLFCARPAAVLLSATGSLSARPVMVTLPGCSWLLSSKKLATAADRAEDRSQLERKRSLKATGMLSVWPSTRTMPPVLLRASPTLMSVSSKPDCSAALPEAKLSCWPRRMITLSPSRSTAARPCSLCSLSSARIASYLLAASVARPSAFARP